MWAFTVRTVMPSCWPISALRAPDLASRSTSISRRQASCRSQQAGVARREPGPDLPLARMHSPNGRHDLRVVEEFRQIAVCPSLRGAGGVLCGIRRRQHDHPHIGRHRPDSPQRLEPVDAPHAQVEQDDVGPPFIEHGKGRLATGRLAHDLEFRLDPEQVHDPGTKHRVVIDDEDSNHRTACRLAAWDHCLGKDAQIILSACRRRHHLPSGPRYNAAAPRKP